MHKSLEHLCAVAALCAAAPTQAAPDIVTYPCKVVGVATFKSRVHVECAQTLTTMGYFFAVPASNVVETGNLRALGLYALGHQKLLQVTFDGNDLSGTSFGCANHDCRRPISLSVGP